MFAFSWNGDSQTVYTSHGRGTFNVNPINGAGGLFVGEEPLSEIIKQEFLTTSIPVKFTTESILESAEELTGQYLNYNGSI